MPELVHKPGTDTLRLAVLLRRDIPCALGALQEAVPELFAMLVHLVIDLSPGLGAGDPRPDRTRIVEDLADLFDLVAYAFERLHRGLALTHDVGLADRVAKVRTPGYTQLLRQLLQHLG